MTVGRFEWLTLPDAADETPPEADDQNTIARECPECGWVDSVQRFRDLARQAEPNAGDEVRECWRCGARFDLDSEIQAYFSEHEVRLPPLKLKIEADAKTMLRRGAAAATFDLHLASQRLRLRRGFDRLVSLDLLNIARYEHQIETASRVLSEMRGEALLADEVGLGKTIEAGIVLKELVLRGLARRILVIVPAGLLEQWREELAEKLGEREFCLYRNAGDARKDRIIVSYSRAQRSPHAAALQARRWDLLILDEAHKLKGRGTQRYRFVRELKRRYALFLTATPVHNDLTEIYSLVSLIKPGLLGTIRSFKRTFVDRTDPRKPLNREHLRETLADVMIRNRRDAIGVRFPPRRAGVYYVELTAAERKLYEGVSQYVREEFKREVREENGNNAHMLSLTTLQKELTSSAAAVEQTLRKLARRKDRPATTRDRLNRFADLAGRIEVDTKTRALMEILSRFGQARFVVFVGFLRTCERLKERVCASGRRPFLFHGSLSAAQRQRVLDRFRETPGGVLISTEAGGEGFNLQFAQHLVNYDLPWNPMRLEQRIGRLHRLGQEKEVSIFNLACADTIEERIIDVLGKKLRMFELVVGELDAVLGEMPGEGSFEQRIARIVARAESESDVEKEMELVGNQAAEARERYDRIREAQAALAS